MADAESKLSDLDFDFKEYKRQCICDQLEKCDFCSARGVNTFFEDVNGDLYCGECLFDWLYTEVQRLMLSGD